MGPFSIVNSKSGLAFAVDDSVCANGMSLTLADDDHTSLTQQFYLGQHGSIFSAKCRGLVIESIDMVSVQLQIFRVKDIKQKWKFTHGMIESVMHPGTILAYKNTVLPPRKVILQPEPVLSNATLSNATSLTDEATYDQTYKAPRCVDAVAVCDTGTSLIRGRGENPKHGNAEPNQPNTYVFISFLFPFNSPMSS